MTSSAMDKIMKAMAAAEQHPDDDAGARLLALIRDGGRVDTSAAKRGCRPPTSSPPPSSASSSSSPGARASASANANLLLTGGAGGESKIIYDREFLFSCADSPICREMPKMLATKLDEFPQMRRRLRSQADHIRLFEHQPSIVDSLPLRPTAQIFTWDPNVGQWVPRARPQEV